ncbi:hypothetical protein BH11ACT4_BH11ACT4_06360 [soil metagenome]
MLVAVPAAILGIPIIAHQNQGLSHQDAATETWPLQVTARGDDSRTRTLSVASDTGAPVDTSALEPGQHLVVNGSGYDGSRGIYVAICVIPTDPATKPGPCVGGVPTQEQQAVAAGTVQYAPSNWINDDWAWKLFGARSYDDLAAGTFTAYIEVGEPKGSGFDCTVDHCGLFTRNDHTALADRVQDLYIPIAYR